MARGVIYPPSAALEELMREDAERGVDMLNAEPLPPAPPEQLSPLIPFAIPPPDWRAEEEERAEREAREATAANQAEHEPEQPSYPAPKRSWTT